MIKKRYKIKKKKLIFSKGPIHLVDCEVRMENGKVLSRQILEHPGAVVIIPRISKDSYILVRQFRFAAGDWLWEFPAGGIERGENLKAAAIRESMEEIGFHPKKLKKILQFYPTPGVSGEIMYLFLAENLVPEAATCDEDEELEVKTFSLREIGQMIRKEKIVDAKTILGYYFLKQMS
jgi:ADP-ribose pyrophosphatase